MTFHGQIPSTASAIQALEEHKKTYGGRDFMLGFNRCRQAYVSEQVGRNRRLHYFISAGYDYALKASKNERLFDALLEDSYFLRFSSKCTVRKVLRLTICCLMDVGLETPEYRLACRYAAALNDDFEAKTPSEEVAQKLDDIGIEQLYRQRKPKNKKRASTCTEVEYKLPEKDGSDCEKATVGLSLKSSRQKINPYKPKTWPESALPQIALQVTPEDFNKIFSESGAPASGIIYFDRGAGGEFKLLRAKVISYRNE